MILVIGIIKFRFPIGHGQASQGIMTTCPQILGTIVEAKNQIFWLM